MTISQQDSQKLWGSKEWIGSRNYFRSYLYISIYKLMWRVALWFPGVQKSSGKGKRWGVIIDFYMKLFTGSYYFYICSLSYKYSSKGIRKAKATFLCICQTTGIILSQPWCLRGGEIYCWEAWFLQVKSTFSFPVFIAKPMSSMKLSIESILLNTI